MTIPDQRTRDLVVRIAERRAIGWRVLLAAFAPPTPQAVVELCDGDTRAVIVHATAWLDSDRDRFDPDLALLDAYRSTACTRPVEAVADELTAEHTRLFADGVGLVALRESAYLPDGDPATAIQAFLDGQTLSPGRSNLEPDHLLVQLAGAAALAQRERDAWASGDFEQAKVLRAVQQEFLLAHMARFVPALCDRLTHAARLDLYRGWAGLLRSYLSIEAGVDYGRTVLSEKFTPRT
ncbi:MAG: molecular chaperone TorD family protein [Dermatophilaceae bacterium]